MMVSTPTRLWGAKNGEAGCYKTVSSVACELPSCTCQFLSQQSALREPKRQHSLSTQPRPSVQTTQSTQHGKHK
jgi:hypothetical protein